MSERAAGSADKGPARWLVSVGLKFLRVVPFLTVGVVIATLISEASLLLAFLLPLKVIILVGSEGVPAYFPSFLAVYEKQDLIPALALCAIGFYLLHQLGDRVATRMTGEGTTTLMAKSRKITLFENQDQLAERAFQRYATMVANSVFVTLSLMVMSALYPALAALLAAYAMIALGGAFAASRISARVRTQLAAGPGGYAGLAADVGFLLAFSFIILDYLRGAAPSVLICIVSIILTRQSVRRSVALVLGVHALVTKRLEISALFFHGQSMLVRPPQTGFWQLLQQAERARWVPGLLEKTLGSEVSLQSTAYRQLGIKGVVGIVAEGEISSSGERFSKLIKLFNTPLRSQAQHEATLLADRSLSMLPAANLVTVDEVEGFQAHVFDWNETDAKAVDKQVFRGLKYELAGVQPPEALVDQFKRSRPMLWDRLEADEVRRAGFAATDEDERDLAARLEMVADALIAHLKRTPLQLVNIGQSADTIALDTDGRVMSLHWGGWSLEPFGSSLLSAADKPKLAGKILDAASESRSDLGGVSVPEMQLTAMVYEFVQHCEQQRYRNALRSLRLLLSHYETFFQDSEAA